VKPLFSAATREHGIYFAYPWSEHDSVEIQLPAAFSLDSAESAGRDRGCKEYWIDEDPYQLRQADERPPIQAGLSFGGGSVVLFPKVAYPH
jgi:hypothetical protein